MMKPLKACAHFIDYRGRTPKKTESGIRLITAKNVRMGYLKDEPEEYIDEGGYDEWMTRGIPSKGDVLFTTEAPLGNVALLNTNEKRVFAQRLITLKPNSDIITGPYLCYALLSPPLQKAINENATGATVKGIKAKLLKEILLPTPPLKEQNRIVAILDEAFASIETAKANTEKNLANAKELFDSELNRVFTQKGEGWVEKKLGDICDPEKGITYGVIKLGAESPQGVPCLRTSNVRWLKIEHSKVKQISAELSDAYSRTILKGAEVLVNVRGTLGGVAVVPTEMSGWNVSREIAVVPVIPSLILPDFASYCVGSKVSQDWLRGVQKGAAYAGVNLKDLRQLPVKMPALEKQLEIVNKLQKCQGLAHQLETISFEKLDLLDQLKQSILQKAFSGELTADLKALDQ